MRVPRLIRVAVGLLVVPLITMNPLAAQETGTITGTVTDALSGQPMVGASVQIPELELGVLTNVDGRYIFPNVPRGSWTVTASTIGYGTVEQSVSLSGETAVLDFVLDIQPIQLDRLVVTGQQIARQSREVAYAVSSIGGEEINEVQEVDFVQALQGLAPGLNIVQQSGNVGGSTRIVLRGVNSLSGDNQPLFVVDGVPISNSNINPDNRLSGFGGAIDVGNRASDLSSDNIENVTVLRGAAAAALYGQRAKNGVILIETKKGRSIGGLTVTAGTTIRSDAPLRLPDFQNTFAQGDFGAYDAQDLDGWGPVIAGQTVEDINGNTVTLQARPNNVRDFYDDATLIINNVAVSAANDQADFRLGLTYQDQAGIVPSSNLDRTSINLNTGIKARPDLQARVSGFYTRTTSVGRAVAGGNNPNVLTSLVNGLPRTFDITALRDYKDEFGNQIPISQTTNNPYWVVNENQFSNEVDRLFGTVSLDYTPTDWITVTGRAGADVYTEDRSNINAVGTIGREDGRFAADVIQEKQFNFDLLAQADNQLTEDFSLRSVLGANLNTRETEIQRVEASNLTVPDLLTFANAAAAVPINSFSQRKVYGIYGDLTLGFRDYLFLNLTGRNDWSSTLPVDNRSYFYPSANLSFVLTDAIPSLRSDVFSYAKLRANFAQVGSDEAPYQLAFRFFPTSSIFGQYGTGNNFPFGGRTAFEATDVIPPADLQPQNQVSLEFGGEFQFFDGRAGFDFTYYDVRTKDQILSIPIPESTGFAANRTNIGEVSNEGVELQVNLNPIRTSTFGWDVLLNYTQNQNTVVSLAPGVEEIIIESGFSSLQVKAEPGRSFGLYGPGFLRNDEGQLIIDEATGLRQEGDLTRLGSIDPDFRMGINNTFTFGNFTLGALIDWREGGSIFSQTVKNLRSSGLAEETAVNRDGTFIDEGVIENPDGTFRPNDVPVSSMQQFWQRYSAQSIHEGAVFDASNARLREVRLDWNVPREWIENTPFGRLSVGIEGRNLWLFYKKVPHIDPETGLFGSASDGQGIEWNVLPSTRSFGLNIQAAF